MNTKCQPQKESESVENVEKLKNKKYLHILSGIFLFSSKY